MSVILYSNQWRLDKAGQDLLWCLPHMPRVIPTNRANIIDVSQEHEPEKVIVASAVPYLPRVPTLQRLQEALREIEWLY